MKDFYVVEWSDFSYNKRGDFFSSEVLENWDEAMTIALDLFEHGYDDESSTSLGIMVYDDEDVFTNDSGFFELQADNIAKEVIGLEEILELRHFMEPRKQSLL